MSNILQSQEKSEKILPVYFPPPITMFLHHAIYLSILLAREINFLYGHYIQLYKNTASEYLFDFYPHSFDSLLNNNAYSVNILSADIWDIPKNDIVDITLNWLDNGYYPLFETDESLLSGTRGNLKAMPKIHQAFYFGYNLDKKVFKMMNFNAKGTFSVLDIPFKDFQHVFKLEESKRLIFEKKGTKDFYVKLLKVQDANIRYNYETGKMGKLIFRGLDDYLNARDSESQNYFKFSRYDEGTTVWGTKIYEYFIRFLKGEYESKFSYQCICGIYEHKKIMYDRLNFLLQHHFIQSPSLITEYQAVVEKAERFRYLMFRYLAAKQEDSIKEMIAIIGCFQEYEPEVLGKVLQELLRNI